MRGELRLAGGVLDSPAKNFTFYPKGRGRYRFCGFRSSWNLEVSLEEKEYAGNSGFVNFTVNEEPLSIFEQWVFSGLPCLARTVWFRTGCRYNFLESLEDYQMSWQA